MRHENTLALGVALIDAQSVGISVTSHGVSARGAVLSVVNVFPVHVSVRGAVVSVAVKCPSQRACRRRQCIMREFDPIASEQPDAVAKSGTFFLSIIILLT